MNLHIKDKVFIITGGAKGIGETISRAIAEEGGVPVVVGRSLEAGRQLVQSLQEKGHQAYAICKELGSPESCQEVAEEVLTPLYRKRIDSFDEPEKKLKRIEQNIPLGNRMTRSEEIADMPVFLLSARAAHITGQHLFVDGGYVHLGRSLSVLSPK